MDDKLTIVGPEPMNPGPDKTPRKVNMEALLLMAKYDKDFQKRLFNNRDEALKESGIEFSNSEKALLTSIKNPLLKKYIRNFEIKGITGKSLKSWSCAASIVLLVSSLLIHCSDSGSSEQNPVSKGNAPDPIDISVDNTSKKDTLNDPFNNISQWGLTPDTSLDNTNGK